MLCRRGPLPTASGSTSASPGSARTGWQKCAPAARRMQSRCGGLNWESVPGRPRPPGPCCHRGRRPRGRPGPRRRGPYPGSRRLPHLCEWLAEGTSDPTRRSSPSPSRKHPTCVPCCLACVPCCPNHMSPIPPLPPFSLQPRPSFDRRHCWLARVRNQCDCQGPRRRGRLASAVLPPGRRARRRQPQHQPDGAGNPASGGTGKNWELQWDCLIAHALPASSFATSVCLHACRASFSSRPAATRPRSPCASLCMQPTGSGRARPAARKTTAPRPGAAHVPLQPPSSVTGTLSLSVTLSPFPAPSCSRPGRPSIEDIASSFSGNQLTVSVLAPPTDGGSGEALLCCIAAAAACRKQCSAVQHVADAAMCLAAPQASQA